MASTEKDVVGFNTASHEKFLEYYAAESVSENAINHFRRVRDVVISAADKEGIKGPMLVADIGCGAGTSSALWKEAGHNVIGIDVNEPLIELARERAAKGGLDIDFRVGSASNLPLEDNSVDVCMAVELLEHVEDWETCLQEFIRIVKPGGFLWVSTTNTLCPKQQEFNLPLFSWYPGFLKRHYIKLAQTTRPELANYATYPAFNWFTPYGLKSYLNRHGFESMDRFDVAYAYKDNLHYRKVLKFLKVFPPARLAAYMLTQGTALLAIKRAEEET